LDNLDLQRIALLIGKAEPSVLKDYLEGVANLGLTRYKGIFQWGKKQGESLYVHILNGIFVLDSLRVPLRLTDTETRVLYAAFTVHDINKVLGRDEAFGKLATRETIAGEIKRLNLDAFFPGWEAYVHDITSLVRGHSGHHHSGGERWNVKRTSNYGLGLQRVNALLHLMRAADVVDLSHTLEERSRKADFLGHLNAYLADSGLPVQYQFVTHRVTEMRGLLTNVIHNAIVDELRDRHGAVPLLFYPDGVAYLVERGHEMIIGPDERRSIARRIAGTVSGMTEGKFGDFIRSTAQGIKVDAKCLQLGVSFGRIWREVYSQVQRRNFKPTDLEEKARERAARNLERSARTAPKGLADVERLLDAAEPLVASDPGRLRAAELARSYYIFLSMHFADRISKPWEHIYRLLELPEARWPTYAYFDARYDRAYVLAHDLTLSEEEVYRRIEEDGAALMDEAAAGEDPKAALFDEYLARYVIFGQAGRETVHFDDHLAHYVGSQHRQCVYCSGPFPTAKWMTADVRSDITVQTFSNRLRGGPGEPKKYVCAVCQIQFLLEKLNYPTVRGEKTMYLHLFPYSFLTAPFIQGLKSSVDRIVTEDSAIRALNMRHEEAMQAYLEGKVVPPTFRGRTAKNRPQPYGLYLPRYTETVGNLLIFPVNPAGDNDTERFLFALWNALILQRHFGVKVLLSASPVAPLGKEDFGDLYVDTVPLACRGLLHHNDYAQFKDGTRESGALPRLWDEVGHLFALQRLTRTAGRQDEMTSLVRALGEGPLELIYTTEKLLEARARAGEGQSGGLVTWLSQQAFPHVESLALSKGGVWMAKLSEALERLAEIAWQNRLRGRSLEKSALLFPLDELFQKLGHAGGTADRDVLMAAATMDIFDHLSRIADDQFKPGRKKWEATKAFVDAFFVGVLDGVYDGNVRKLMADEKLLRSAFLFYVREQIPRRGVPGDPDSEPDGEA